MIDLYRLHPEMQIGGFSQNDGQVDFYSRVNSLVSPDSVVLDFGAGRGAHILEDSSPYRRSLKNFRGRCREVIGVDVDSAVLDNPFLDRALVVSPDAPLPLPDNSVDVIVSQSVFEHVEDAQAVVGELLRVVRPGGTICGMTPNSWGYIAIGARLVPNSFHRRVLARAQAGRRDEDVFPTRYAMNSQRQVEVLFSQATRVVQYTHSPDPRYHFNNVFLYRAIGLLQRVLPSALATTRYLFVTR